MVWKEWYVLSAQNLGCWEDIETLVEEKVLCDGGRGINRLNHVWLLPRKTQSFALPALINSKLMRILNGADDDGNLCTFLDCALNDQRKRAYLEAEMAVQLAVVAVNQEKHQEAKSLLSAAQVTWINRLAQCSILSRSAMYDVLKDVHVMTELRDFLAVMLCKSGSAKDDMADQKISKWTHREIREENLTQNQFILAYRDLYLHFLKPLLSPNGRGLCVQAKISSNISIIESSLQHSNPHLAYRYLMKLDSLPKDKPTECLALFMKAETSIIRASAKEPHPRMQYLLESWSKYVTKIDKYIKANQGIQEEGRYALLETKFFLRICECLKELGNNFNPRDKHLMPLTSKFPQFDTTSPQNWCKTLLESSLRTMQKKEEFFMPESNYSNQQGTYDNLLSKKNDDALFEFYESVLEEWHEVVDVSKFTALFMSTVLRGMALGSRNAHYRFPKLIHCLEKDTSLIPLFAEGCRKVPSWMYLLWISHILIYVDKSPGPALHPIVKRVAYDYPYALIYPFEIGLSSYDFEGPNGREAQKMSEEVKLALSKLTLARKFVSAISLVHSPYTKIKEKIKGLRKYSNLNEKASALLDCYNTFFDERTWSKDSCSERGSAYKTNDAFFKEIKKCFEKYCGNDIEKIRSLTSNQFSEMVQHLHEIPEKKSSSKVSCELNHYSPWLAAFSAIDYEEEIELPGQYHGLSKPLLEYHTKIVSFASSLQPMKSLRVPMKITIRGNDQMDYSFLVKSGEDLRTDHRMQSIFSLLNNIYDSQDTSRLSCKPLLNTFQVIPLTMDVGLVEWVNHTQPLKGFFSTSQDEGFNTAAEIYNSKKSWVYDKKVLKRDECVNTFEEAVNQLPWDLLRSALCRLAVSHEGFFYLRNAFISSHATLCVSQWLLGIGDRHLLNFLISLKSGRLIGIDFGYHFETSTQFTPSPELVPFRLTAQFMNVMQPLGYQGLFRETMIVCLSALRKRRSVVLAAVEAFVRQPTEDWKLFISLESGPRTSFNEEEFSDFSIGKMNDFKGKLNGRDPTEPIISALSKNKYLALKKKVSLYIDFLKGEGTDRLRTRLRSNQGTGIYSVQDQVDILIDVATDPNLLGRMYIGWTPYA